VLNLTTGWLRTTGWLLEVGALIFFGPLEAKCSLWSGHSVRVAAQILQSSPLHSRWFLQDNSDAEHCSGGSCAGAA
jgi:hypothetical protein